MEEPDEKEALVASHEGIHVRLFSSSEVNSEAPLWREVNLAAESLLRHDDGTKRSDIGSTSASFTRSERDIYSPLPPNTHNDV
jgi:hypothetical protein